MNGSPLRSLSAPFLANHWPPSSVRASHSSALPFDLILERNRDLLKRGTVLVDPDDPGEAVRALFYLEHTIQDGRTDKAGNRRVVSRQLQFVETDATGSTRNAGYAPYLDYRPATPEERTGLAETLESQAWLKGDLESVVVGHAIANLVPVHLDEVRNRREDLVTRTMAAVTDRLTKEITFKSRIGITAPTSLKTRSWPARRTPRSILERAASAPMSCRPAFSDGWRNSNSNARFHRCRRSPSAAHLSSP